MSANPKLKVINNLAYASSLDLAKHFNKRHADVLRAIENRLSDCSEGFNERNFAPVTYRDVKGESRRMYQLTRDGFAFVAMNFTGKEAARWQEAYINAFNELEQEIRGKQFHSTLDNQLKLFPDFNKDISAERPAMPIRFAYEQMIRKCIPSVTPDTIKNMVKRGELEGYKANGFWYVYDESFANYLKNRKL